MKIGSDMSSDSDTRKFSTSDSDTRFLRTSDTDTTLDRGMSDDLGHGHTSDTRVRSSLGAAKPRTKEQF